MNNKICVFGASGVSGLAITELAVSQGLEVTAFVRSEAAKDKLPQDATVVVGNLLNLNDVEGAVNGRDAIVCAFGPRPSSPEIFCADATKNIILAMKKHDLRRLLCITGAMIGDYPHLSWFMRRMKSSFQKQQPAIAQDRAEQEQLVESSGLEWTLIKPPRLTNDKARGRIRSAENLKVGAMSKISRKDLSQFILDQIESRKYIGKKVVVQD